MSDTNINVRTVSAPAKPDSKNSRELLFRLAIGALLLVSIGLLWWSFGRVLSPRIRQSRELTTTVSRLSADVDDLDRQWTPADVSAVTNQFALVPGRLFPDQMALEFWLVGLKGQVNSLAMTIKADFGKTTTEEQGGQTFGIIPTSNSVEIDSAPAASGIPSPYQRLLQLIQTIASQEKRADLTELSVEGGSNSIYRATLGYNFWTSGGATP